MDRLQRAVSLGIMLGVACARTPSPAADAPAPAEVAANAPSSLSVTVYRAPARESGSFDLDDLGGFALVSETRMVHLPAGASRLRFEGVADGIEPVSAIVTGLDGIAEKNREGQLLSPEALLEKANGRPVMLVRSDRKTGKAARIPVTLRSDAGGGVVIDTPDGVEALRCSGLPETLGFSGTSGLSATPTLSVLVRAPKEVTRTVTLSYLSRDFDWAADYIATWSEDGGTLDLGAWVTLANGNGVGFPAAHTQVVAGRLNRESGEVEPLGLGGPILARCWPRGSTSDQAPPMMLERAYKASDSALAYTQSALAAAPAEVAVAGMRRVEQEQLGDLKLYRVPETTDVASRQSKQVRLLDREAIPVHLIYRADLGLDTWHDQGSFPAEVILRTQNDMAHHLGLPLPSGRVAVFQSASGTQGAPVLRYEAKLRDLAVDEEVEIEMGESADVRVGVVGEKVDIDPAQAKELTLVPGVKVRTTKETAIVRVEITNARAKDAAFELRLRLPEGAEIVRADHRLGKKNGRPIFKLTVPGESTATVRFQVQATKDSLR